jgi:hypothetical protein
MEVVEVNGGVLRQDLDVEPDGYDEKRTKEGDDETYVVFESVTGEGGEE